MTYAFPLSPRVRAKRSINCTKNSRISRSRMNLEIIRWRRTQSTRKNTH
jgi:hypothetical protein